ncbi:MAG: LysM peptidoglycan-binding domain-containing protein [Chloroflexi bacterium]|nr:LysM peptidoglycan-binding domain-containing protein [Chloroflexota bacterium]
MMERLSFLENISRNAVYTVLAIIAMIGAAAGYVYFFTSTIEPSLRNRDKVMTQLADARKSLADTRRVADLSPIDFQRQLSTTQSTLATYRSAFLTEQQASQIPAGLYQEANAAQVQITDLQTQIVTTQTVSSPYIVSTIRLQAQGDSYRLVDFAAHMKELALKGIVVNNVNMVQDKNTSRLTMDLTLYTSPVVPGDLRTAARVTPTPTLEPTAIPTVAPPPPPIVEPTRPLLPTSTPAPSATPTVQRTLHVVRPGDTLYSLARLYGTSVDAIMKANGLPTQNIFAGQTLVIPSR